MEQGHTGYWYQDGANASHGAGDYSFGEFNDMLENPVSDMQNEFTAGPYAGQPTASHQMNAGHYASGQFSGPSDGAQTRQPQHVYQDMTKQSSSQAYTQPSNGLGHHPSLNQHGQFNSAYQQRFDPAGQQQQQQQRPSYEAQSHANGAQFQSHATNAYQQGQSAAYAVPQSTQGHYAQQHSLHPQYQHIVAQPGARNVASPVPQSARHTPVQASGYAEPGAPQQGSDTAAKAQPTHNHQNPQQSHTTQFIPQYNGQNPGYSPAVQATHVYNGKQSPAPAVQQAPYQNTPSGTYHANGYQQGAVGSAQSGTTSQVNASPGPYFQPYMAPVQAQAHGAHTAMQGQPHIMQNKQAMTGGTSYSTIQPYQIQPQPQPSVPVVFQVVPNHPNLSISSAPVRYRPKAGRPEATFIPLEHTFKTEPPEAKIGAKRKASDAKETEESSGSESEEEADDETEIDREAVKIMAKMGVPRDTPAGVEQHVVQRIWQDRNAVYDKEKTSRAIQWFGAFVDGLWVEVKKIKDDLKTAEEKGDKDKISSLQAAARHQNEMMHTAIRSADKYGEDYLVSNMGGNRKLCTIMRNALANCFTSKDFTGPYPRVLLKLMSRFTTVDTEFLTKLKLDALRTKYGDQIDSEMKGYIDQINKNAKLRDEKTKSSEVKKVATKPVSTEPTKRPVPSASAASKVVPVKKDLDTKKPVPEIKKIDYSGLGSARKLANGAAKPSINGSPVKRPRDDDPDSRNTKKVAVEGSVWAPTTKSSTSTTPASQGAQGASAVKPKPSASILPGKARTIVKPVTKRPEPAAPSAFSSISGLLAEIAKPKETPKTREEPERKPETPEETAKRLRKEKRRKLRVVWKPDDQLEEVRIFQHDAAEDEGRASNMLRDARDNRSEGQMLKMGIQTDEEDDAEDDGKPKETSLRQWVVPNTISFSQIGEAQRDKSFVSRGGVKDIVSEQQKFMEEYESRELMAVYTTAAEIPETPRSPPQRAFSEMETTPKIAVLPTDNSKMQEIHRRWAEFGQYGPVAAQQLALSRLGLDHSGTSKQASEHAKPSTAPMRYMTQEERDEAVLVLLRSEAVKNWKDPSPFDPGNPRTHRRRDYPDPKVQEAADAIESICEKLRGKPFPPTEPPEHITAPERAREWWVGHEKDTATRAIRDAKGRAKSLADEHARNAAVAKAAKDAQAAAQAAAAAAPTAGSNDMAAWAAYFAQAQGQQPQQHGGQTQDPAYAAILQQVQVLQSGQQPQQPAQPPQATANDVQSLLAALSGGQPTTAAAQPAVDPTAAAWAAYYQQQAQAQTQAQQPDQQAAWAAYYAQFGAQPQQSNNTANASEQGLHPSRLQQREQHDQHRDHERDWDHDNDRNSRHHDNYRDGGSRHHGRDRGGERVDRGGGAQQHNNRGINRALIGTKPCSFWAKGQCAKGDQCTFRHDPNDLK